MTKENNAPLIKIDNVSRYYKTGDVVVKALDEVNIEIYPGEFVAIMGQSGSGKSTLMNILGCLDRSTGGIYTVQGRNVASLDADELAALRRDTFGFIFQRYNLLNTVSAEDNIKIPAIYAGLSAPERELRAKKLLNDLGLGARGHHIPSELSGGQQQRVAIARALVNDPPVILADEPTGALDSQSSGDVMALLKDLNQQGRTVILITHEEDVAKHARRMIRILDGKVESDNGIDREGIAIANAHKKLSSKIDRSENLVAEVSEAVKTAISALRVNLFRTALTLLGIIIGVAAVITMLAVGNGSKQNVLDQISSMGTNILSIRPGAPGIRSSNIATMVPADAKAIKNEISNISVVVPQRSGSKTLRMGNIDYSSSIEGVGEGYPQARDWALKQGTFFTESDVNSYASVAVLGTTVTNIFFSEKQNPIGKFILLGNIPFEIIGVMETKGSDQGGNDQDDNVWVPYTTSMGRLFGSNYLNGITIKVDDVSKITQTENDINELLLNRHQTIDFRVRNSASFLEMATATQDTLTILLGAVAAISLLVGGIGVMNIMLVSVVERTREIGVRMATGARRRDIMMQFNIEASVVCTIGGIIGVVLGFCSSYILSLFGVDIMFSVMPAVLAFTCAVSTGILFGYLPAKKAAHLDPVVALSSE
tara:strand:+ start:143055 stop:145013 length:1959 start_codon:yes stop_codon:yes gene_type:complete